MYLPSITGMSDIVSRPTNLRWQLKGFNRLTVSHSVNPARDNSYSIWLQKYLPENLVANGCYCDDLEKGVILTNFKNNKII